MYLLYYDQTIDPQVCLTLANRVTSNDYSKFQVPIGTIHTGKIICECCVTYFYRIFWIFDIFEFSRYLAFLNVC